VSAPSAAVIVLAKAPEPGRVKTRLCPPATPAEAADLAAAALLDTLDAAAGVPGAQPVVALTGRLAGAVRRAELAAALRGFRVVPQRGAALGERIAAAHADTAALFAGCPTLQIGMDTPQAGAGLLAACLDRLRAPGTDGVLGLATDGGWWALGLRDPYAARLVAGVPTSRDDTGERTLRALHDGGLRIGLLPELTDVDTAADARAVADAAPGGRFAAAVERCPAFELAS
jgi:glycosyltransferase A (GT-A) superfamily protein (DUF2064 family)